MNWASPHLVFHFQCGQDRGHLPSSVSLPTSPMALVRASPLKFLYILLIQPSPRIASTPQMLQPASPKTQREHLITVVCQWHCHAIHINISLTSSGRSCCRHSGATIDIEFGGNDPCPHSSPILWHDIRVAWRLACHCLPPYSFRR